MQFPLHTQITSSEGDFIPDTKSKVYSGRKRGVQLGFESLTRQHFKLLSNADVDWQSIIPEM